MAPVFRLWLLVAITASAPDAQTVRVRLFADAAPRTATVQSLSAPLAAEAGGRTASAAAGQEVRLGVRGRDVEAAPLALQGETLRLTGGPFLVRVGGEARTYAGDLTVTAIGGALEIVNAVPLEAYVASVVASEYPFEEIEGIKAQAVLARTYALRRGGLTPRYDLDDDQGSQVYRGEGAVTERARRAARETAGEVLTYAGALAETPYFSSSGGHTADNESVWEGTPLPYLRGVPDPADAGSPTHRWTSSAPRRAVERALSDRLGGTARGVGVAERARTGHVLRFRVEGTREPTISGADFRTAVNEATGPQTVRSTNVEVRLDGDRYVFEGRGYGHGVGLSQYGARGLAQQGKTYEEILAHYFPGTTLDARGAPALAETPTRPERPPAADRPATPPRPDPTPTRPAPRRIGW